MTGIVNSKNMRLTALVYDMAMAGLAMYAALILRLGTFEGLDSYSLVGPFDGLDDYNLIFGAILPFVAAAGASLLTLGTYRTSWRHASTADLTNIVKAATLAVLIYMPICFVVNRLYLIPRTSIVLAWMVFLLLMAGSRISYRLFREGHLFFERHPMAPGQVPILIVGGGVDARILLLSLDQACEYYPVGVLDEGDALRILRTVVPEYEAPLRPSPATFPSAAPAVSVASSTRSPQRRSGTRKAEPSLNAAIAAASTIESGENPRDHDIQQDRDLR